VALAEPLAAPPAPSPSLDGLRRVAERARPISLAGERTLPVLPALAGLVPEGGLRRGSTVAVEGPGATTLSLALGAAASAAGSWTAAVGLPSLGLAAAAELGVALERLIVVDPPPDQWAVVVAALLDAVDVVHARPPGRGGVSPGDARRLVARARERGAVLLGPVGGDLRLRIGRATWLGPAGGGAGRLEARRVEVVAGGRGAAARERRVWLELPGPDGAVRMCGESGHRMTGSAAGSSAVGPGPGVPMRMCGESGPWVTGSAAHSSGGEP
jgi:hypothetical protein